MKINELAPGDAIAAVNELNDIEQVREAATSIGITFSGNTGISSLKTKITDTIVAKMDELDNEQDQNEDQQGEGFSLVSPEEEDEVIEVAKAPIKIGPSIAEMVKMDPTKIEDPKLRRLVIRSQALRLSRVRVTNMDPNDSMLEGIILSVTTKYTGKVSKYIPFGENAGAGYHIPQILFDQLKTMQFPFRKEIKGGQFGVKKYKTMMMKKYNIEILQPLTKVELAELASHQKATNAIDREVEIQ